MIIKTFQVSDALSKTKGSPQNWEQASSSVPQSIGLASSERKISTKKIVAFLALDKEDIEEVMNIKSYNFYFTIKNQFGNETLVSHGSIPTGKKAVNIARLVIYENNPSIMEFELWL